MPNCREMCGNIGGFLKRHKGKLTLGAIFLGSAAASGLVVANEESGKVNFVLINNFMNTTMTFVQDNVHQVAEGLTATLAAAPAVVTTLGAAVYGFYTCARKGKGAAQPDGLNLQGGGDGYAALPAGQGDGQRIDEEFGNFEADDHSGFGAS